MRKLAEAHHHTPDEIVEYLGHLSRIYAASDLTEQEYLALAPTILNLLASKQVLYEQPQASPLMLDGLHNLR